MTALTLHEIAEMPLLWGGYIIRPADAKYTDIREAPNACGIYAWHSEDGDLMYVGRSKTIRDRLRKHQINTCFQSGTPKFFSYRCVPESFVAAMEVAHIRALAPFENSFEESAGATVRGPIEPAIKAAWAYVLEEQEARLYGRYSRLIEQIAARLPHTG